ncbi:hypothetical protein RJT34_09845 [Clitoria ternatea]|uniref:FAF domain-containing protein n=1 Tax=Clitoria ternatea TaxID=43366 RepID=A0AAN9K7R5_CLITE
MWSPSSPRFQSTIIGDVIGTESGDYMMSDAVEQMEWEPRPKVRSKERGGRRKKREFPPLITLLRRTGQMPWIFQREYGEEGRLVVAVQKVRCSEYKEARREGGRICMRFVRAQYDDDDDDERAYCEECGYSMDYDEDFEFNEETESVDNAKEEKEEENDFALGKEGSDNCDENEGLGEGVTYGGGAGLLHDSESFCGVGGASASVFLGRACSSPLRPMTPVM